ncbi:MAG: transcriptional repressor NrdR [Planctomycetes bacterium]|nr:transcriptional repressor NrdR [Planctomycetota bacterium]
MRCPFCSDSRSKVVDSRESAAGEAIRRRRECLACERRYTTYERVEEVSLRVIKKDDRREAFERGKIVACLERSCEKLPVSAEAIAELAESIEQEVREVHEREVSSRFIGELIMMRLRALNKVAYVRYASIYREFREPQDFLDELKPLLTPDELGLGGAG